MGKLLRSGWFSVGRHKAKDVVVEPLVEGDLCQLSHRDRLAAEVGRFP